MSTNAAQEAENLEIEQIEARINADRNLNKNRRYVGTKETLAYIIYDISASFNISKYNDVFITDIVQIGLRFQTIVTFVIGIWDVINDIFLAAIIDRTRTRFGKFKPFLILYAGPGLLLSFFYWMMPVFFAGMGKKLPTLFISAGLFTSLASGIMALYFSIVAKERVIQKSEKPSIFQGVKSVITNKPLLILTLVDFLSAFGINSGTNYYYINVLGLASMSTIVGIPGAVVSPISYSYVTKAREHFSTKTLWIFSSVLPDVLMLGVFGVGSINNNYKKRAAMIPAFMIRETIWMGVYGISKVIPEEMRNECIDYGEWKNGYRTEGMTGVAKGLAQKLVSTLGGTIKAFILSRIGYKEGAGYGNQSAHTEYMLFAMCTIIPVATTVLGLIPKFFYPIDSETRDRMYRELAERRQAVAKEMNEKAAQIHVEPQTES